MKKERNQRVVGKGPKRKMSLNIVSYKTFKSDFVSKLSLTLIILYYE